LDNHFGELIDEPILFFDNVNNGFRIGSAEFQKLFSIDCHL
jgi:hypothetical protein